MKTYISKFIIILLFSFVIGATFSSCKVSDNGDLDGQWQIMDVAPPAPEIVLDTRLYLCINLHTCQLTAYGLGPWTSGNIIYDKDKTLTLEFPYALSNLSTARLKQYGIYHSPVTFTIENLSKNHMILRNEDAVVTLRKF